MFYVCCRLFPFFAEHEEPLLFLSAQFIFKKDCPCFPLKSDGVFSAEDKKCAASLALKEKDLKNRKKRDCNQSNPSGSLSNRESAGRLMLRRLPCG